MSKFIRVDDASGDPEFVIVTNPDGDAERYVMLSAYSPVDGVCVDVAVEIDDLVAIVNLAQEK